MRKDRYFYISFAIVCLIYSGYLIKENNRLKKENKGLKKEVSVLIEENYNLGQNNIDLNWQLGEVGQMICKED